MLILFHRDNLKGLVEQYSSIKHTEVKTKILKILALHHIWRLLVDILNLSTLTFYDILEDLAIEHDLKNAYTYTELKGVFFLKKLILIFMKNNTTEKLQFLFQSLFHGKIWYELYYKHGCEHAIRVREKQVLNSMIFYMYKICD